MIRTRPLGAALAIAVLPLAAACGGGDDDGEAAGDEIVIEQSAGTGAAASSSDAGAGGRSDEEAARAFADCMRENGIEDFPDPTVNADGSVDFGIQPGGQDEGGGPGAGGGAELADDADFEAATEACGELLDGTSLLPSDEDLTEVEDDLVEAAECLRDQGIEVDDPQLGGDAGDGGTGGPLGDEFDPDDPEVAAAIEACQDVFTDIQAPGGN